jgi:hypothetical protein
VICLSSSLCPSTLVIEFALRTGNAFAQGYD